MGSRRDRVELTSRKQGQGKGTTALDFDSLNLLKLYVSVAAHLRDAKLSLSSRGGGKVFP